MVLATRDYQWRDALVDDKCTQAPEGNSTYCQLVRSMGARIPN